MTNVKVSLSILLPGSTMFSKEESLKQLTRPAKDKKNVLETVTVHDFDKHDKLTLSLNDRGKTTTTTILTRKSKNAKQVINLSEEAYNYMTSKNEIPAEFKGAWSALTPTQRLKWHCDRIAMTLGGIVEGFQVLD